MLVNISILIPVYNVSRYINACIESILPAMQDGDEIILVDDGSKDDSGDLCDRWQQQHPELIRVIHQKNSGLSAARNRAFLESTKQYVYFLDSDDLLCADELGALRQQLSLFNPDILTCDALIWRESEPQSKSHLIRHSLPIGICKSHELTLTSTFQDDFLSSSCRLFKRAFLAQWAPEIFPNGQYYEDNSTIPQLIMKAECVYYSGRPIFRYRIRDGSITQTPSLQRCLDQGTSFKNVLVLLNELQLDEKVKMAANVLAFKHIVMAVRNAAQIRSSRWSDIDSVITRGLASLTSSPNDLIAELADTPETSKLLRHANGMLRHRTLYIATRLLAGSLKKLRLKSTIARE